MDPLLRTASKAIEGLGVSSEEGDFHQTFGSYYGQKRLGNGNEKNGCSPRRKISKGTNATYRRQGLQTVRKPVDEAAHKTHKDTDNLSR
jgi:hypothetical protein